MSACSLYMHAYTHEHTHVNMDIDMQTHRMHIYQNKRVKPTSPQNIHLIGTSRKTFDQK